MASTEGERREGSSTTDREDSLPPGAGGWIHRHRDDGDRGDVDRAQPYDEAPGSIEGAVGPPPPTAPNDVDQAGASTESGHRRAVTDELLHGRRSHDDPTLPENQE